MKQRWLIELPPRDESTLTLELDSETQVDLVALMATAIECLHLQQSNIHQQAKEALTDERTTSASQD